MEAQSIVVDTAALLNVSQSDRAPGLHASSIYSNYYQDLEPTRYRKNDDGPPPLLLETGLVFEQMLEEGLKRHVSLADPLMQRPGEMTHTDTYEGQPFTIYYNPDLLAFTDGAIRVGEIKATYLSSHVPHDWLADLEAREQHQYDLASAALHPKLSKFHTQMQFYCAMLGTASARLYVWFVAGDYSRPLRPQFLVWDIEYSQDEIDTTYATMIRHAASKNMLACQL